MTTRSPAPAPIEHRGGWGDPERSAVARCVCVRTEPGHHPGCPVAEYWPDLPPSHRRETRTRRALVAGRWETVEYDVLVPIPEPELVAVLDTETTGLRPDGRVCEVAVVVVDLASGAIVRRGSQLVDPGVPMPREATAVHGLTDADLEGRPTLAELWPRIAALVGSCDVVAHNAEFDRDVLRHSGVDTPRWDWRCSLRLAREVVPGLPSYSLSGRGDGRPSLRESLRLGDAVAHRALGDAETTARLLVRLRERAKRTWWEWRGPPMG